MDEKALSEIQYVMMYQGVMVHGYLYDDIPSFNAV